jgi:uncharacterized protein YkwD
MSAASRLRYTLVGGAVAVVIGVGFTAAGLARHTAANADRRAGAPTPAGAAASDPGDPASYPAPDLVPAGDEPTPAASTPSPTAAATTPPARAHTPARSPQPRPRPTTRRPAPPPVTSGSVVQQVLAHINAARAQAGLPAYALSADLSTASALHNQLMINGCGMSHQCPGEGGIGDRFSAQGVRWTSAGENIGYGSAGAGQSAIVRAADGLTDSMLAERPPDDGHRRNLLSSGFKRIGLSVVRDGKGLVWMTQDFVN